MYDEKKKVVDLTAFDFGFELVDDNELEVVKTIKQSQEESEEEALEWKEKAHIIYNSIQPLLKNLSGDPEKNYIYWPSKERIQKIEAFKKHLENLLN
jgi:hypothetical protein